MEQKRRSDKGKVPAAKRGTLSEEKLAMNVCFQSEDVKRQFSSCWRYVASAEWGHGTYKGDPNCASMDCVDLVLVLGSGFGVDFIL